MDEWNARIAELRARQNPSSQTEQQAEEARKHASQTWQDTHGEAASATEFIPSPELKRLFREVARRIHPDFATDPADLERRTRLMAEANRAYQAGDADALRRILDEYRDGADAIPGEGTGAELIRLIRQISQARDRIAAIERELAVLRQSEIARLAQDEEDAKLEGRDLLAELADSVRVRIRIAREMSTESWWWRPDARKAMDKPEFELKLRDGQLLVSISAGRSRLIARGSKDAADLTKVRQDSPVPISKSRAWKLAEQGDSEAQWEIGWVYSVGGVTPDGWSVPCGVQCTNEDIILEGGRDYEEAARWFRKAAEQGLARAQCSLGDAHKRGDGLPKDLVEAALWYDRAAKQGYAPAQFELGSSYESGLGIDQDRAEAFNWYRKSADNGYHLALFKMGVLYSEGKDVRPDYAEAVRCFQEAAKRGLSAAYINLGHLYAEGKGVPQDEAEAVRLYRFAADEGFTSAQNHLGVMYFEGRGVSTSHSEAANWFRKAAEQGDSHGMLNLGRTLWAQGNYAEAYLWLSAAATNSKAPPGGRVP